MNVETLGLLGHGLVVRHDVLGLPERDMKTNVLVYIDGGFFTVKMADGREFLLAFNDARKAGAFGQAAMRQANSDRMILVVEIDLGQYTIRQALREFIKDSSELKGFDRVEIVTESDPLFSLLVEELVDRERREES